MKGQIKKIISIVLVIALLGTSCVFAEETDSPVKILNYVEEPGATIYNTLQWDWSESGFETDSIVPYDPGNGGWTYTENNYVSTAFYSTSTSPNYNCYLYAIFK